jgi:hypothetical protein
LELWFELELLLWFELELELWFELELLLELELELLLWFELELLLELELELLLWFEPALELAADTRLRRLIVRRLCLIVIRLWLMVRRFCTARARHHSIGFPSIFRSTGTAVRGALREIGGTLALPPSDRDDTGSRAAPAARPRALSAPAYIARILLLRIGMSTSLSCSPRLLTTSGFRTSPSQH